MLKGITKQKNINLITLLLDVSFSMNGEGIQQLNSALPKFITELKNAVVEPESSIYPNNTNEMYISVVTFSDTAEVIIPFTEISNLEKSSIPVLVPKGGTQLDKGIYESIENVEEFLANLRVKIKDTGLGVNAFIARPLFFVMSDGAPTCGIDALENAIDSLNNHPVMKKAVRVSLGATNHCKMDIMKKFMRTFNSRYEEVDSCTKIEDFAEFDKFFTQLAIQTSEIQYNKRSNEQSEDGVSLD